MTEELTQIERAVRFVTRVYATPPDSTAILKGDDLLDAIAICVEFERLLTKELNQIEAGRKFGHLGASHGHKGGRPKSKHPTKASLIKRKSKPKLKP